MSQFSSIKVRINNNDHQSTLLAEYGGDYEIKIWILDKDTAWTGELSSAEAQVFITHFTLTEKIFVEELKKALTSSDPEVKYSIGKKESKGYIFSWKRSLDTGIAVKMGEMRIVELSLRDTYEEVFDRCFENNSLLYSQINSLKMERDNLLAEKNQVLSSFEKAVEQKISFEQTLYSQFLAVLNAKKEKIRQLEAELDTLTESEGSRTKVLKTTKSGKREASEPQPQPQSQSQRQTTKKETARSAQRKETAEGDVEPYDIDTDVDTQPSGSDNECGESSNKLKQGAASASASKLRSQSSDLFSSFEEEVPSPVALLPKRSRLNPKETSQRRIKTSDKNISDQDIDNDDENLLDLL